MKRFILLSFAFIGIGFYELSGGSDFDPEAARANALEARLEREAARREAIGAVKIARTSAPQTPRPETAPDDVSPAGLNLATFEAITRPAPAPRSPIATASATPPPAEDPVTPLDIASLERPAPVLSSIAFAGNTLTAAPVETAPSTDIRSIKGSLVNMRSGPGTDYDVVDQLTQATRVEILSDSGNGWVELRPVGGGARGWIAAFLLTDG